jgi:hypothetical protein
MSGCNKERRRLGLECPRTCALCGLGPCRTNPEPARQDAAALAVVIAAAILPNDRARRDELMTLLAAFAAEIKRSATEP